MNETSLRTANDYTKIARKKQNTS